MSASQVSHALDLKVFWQVMKIIASDLASSQYSTSGEIKGTGSPSAAILPHERVPPYLAPFRDKYHWFRSES